MESTVSAIGDDVGTIKSLVRREHTFGSDWIKTTNTGGYFSAGDDPARVTWFDDEMEVLTSTVEALAKTDIGKAELGTVLERQS
jgi:hypothetical protein